jgi:membrane protein implicated in regulation of membrane protease activity
MAMVAITFALTSAAAIIIAVTISIPGTVAVAIAIVVSMAVTLSIDGGVFAAIPVILYEIDRPAAGAIAAAIATPIAGMAGRDAQIDRRVGHGSGTDEHRFGEEQWRGRESTDVESAIETWLTNADRYLCRCGQADKTGEQRESEYANLFHKDISSKCVLN